MSHIFCSIVLFVVQLWWRYVYFHTRQCMCTLTVSTTYQPHRINTHPLSVCFGPSTCALFDCRRGTRAFWLWPEYAHFNTHPRMHSLTHGPMYWWLSPECTFVCPYMRAVRLLPKHACVLIMARVHALQYSPPYAHFNIGYTLLLIVNWMFIRLLLHARSSTAAEVRAHFDYGRSMCTSILNNVHTVQRKRHYLLPYKRDYLPCNGWCTVNAVLLVCH